MLDKTLFDRLKKNIDEEDTTSPETDQCTSDGGIPPSTPKGDHSCPHTKIDMNG